MGFQIISRLRLWLEFMMLFQRDTPHMVVNALIQWLRSGEFQWIRDSSLTASAAWRL